LASMWARHLILRRAGSMPWLLAREWWIII
jgi:hypothetical protein